MLWSDLPSIMVFIIRCKIFITLKIFYINAPFPVISEIMASSCGFNVSIPRSSIRSLCQSHLPKIHLLSCRLPAPAALHFVIQNNKALKTSVRSKSFQFMCSRFRDHFAIFVKIIITVIGCFIDRIITDIAHLRLRVADYWYSIRQIHWLFCIIWIFW